VYSGTPDDTPSRVARSAFSAKTNVARKIPSVTCVSVERTKTRTTRGEYWPPASWIATSVVEKTTPVNVSIPAATVPDSVSAAPGEVRGSHEESAAAPRSIQTVRNERPKAPTTNSPGTNHIDRTTCSRR